jgi:hypothetical protein
MRVQVVSFALFALAADGSSAQITVGQTAVEMSRVD